MRTFGTVVASLAGAVAGAGLALLVAPQSGERTRRQIRHKVDDCASDLCDGVKRGFRTIKPKLAAVLPH